MNKIIDPGHHFELLTLDKHAGDEHEHHLVFVKRCDPNDTMRFPGNSNSHPGTTLQSVLRALHSRVAYLDSQHHCEENTEIMLLLRKANYLLEQRAARRHDVPFDLSADEAIDAKMCPVCGHVVCNHVAYADETRPV